MLTIKWTALLAVGALVMGGGVASAGQPAIVPNAVGGYGTDAQLDMPNNPITWAEGSFPLVQNVLDEYNSNNGQRDSYTLQMNTNSFENGDCFGSCQVVQQFVYSPTQGAFTDPNNPSVLFIQYWYRGYLSTHSACPPGFPLTNFNDCGGNSPLVPVPAQPITNLGNLTLSVQITDGPFIYVFLSVGNEAVYGMEVSDYVGLAGHWTSAEFNVFGDGGSSQAVFDPTPGQDVQMVVQLLANTTPTTPTPPSCDSFSSPITSETNNLFVRGCTAMPGPHPGIQITQDLNNAIQNLAPLSFQQMQLPVAYQQSTGNYLGLDTHGSLDTSCTYDGVTHCAMKSGTWPSLVTLPSGKLEVGFQSSDGHWAYYTSGGRATKTNGLVRAGTSPSIALVGNHIGTNQIAMAFQDGGGSLWVSQGGEGNGVKTSAQLAASTSPSLVWAPNVYPSGALQLGFQGVNGHFWLAENGTGSGVDSTRGMKAGTSPSIAPQYNGHAAFAFQGANGTLWVGTVGTSSASDTGNPMKAGTSPNIAVLIDGTFVVAYQTSLGYLGIYRADANNLNVTSWSTPWQMASAASPTVLPLADVLYEYDVGYQVAFKGLNGHLMIYNGVKSTMPVDQGVVLN